MLPHFFRRAILAGMFMCALACLPARSAAPVTTPVTAIDGLGKGTVTLDGPWQFHLGDDPAWAAPELDDSQWEQLAGGQTWGSQTHPSYEGYAWYRRSLSIKAAPGVNDIQLMIPAIDDVYEIYWNGVRIGGLGSMPPHARYYMPIRPQVYSLGPAQNGVLAIRVWKNFLASNDPSTLGGFEAAPRVGSPDAMAAVLGALDFRWLRSSLFSRSLIGVYTLVALLSAIAWLRNRSQWLFFWMAVLTICPFIEMILAGLRLPWPWDIDTFVTQTDIQFREMAQWFVLLWLLRLDQFRGMVRLTRVVAIVTLVFGVADGALSFCYPGLLSAPQVEILDASFTAVFLPFEILPVIFVGYALYRRLQLDSGRWAVATFAFLNSMLYSVSNAAQQGVRFTHWTLADKIGTPLFVLGGNSINLLQLIRILLFFSIVYALCLYGLEGRRRQLALEREFQSARELQRVLVPETLPALPGYAVTSAYKPAREVGGDFFQLIPLEGKLQGATLVILGDVSGKGLKAAMAVSLIVGMVRALSDRISSPADLLSELNRRLHGRLQEGFATCLAMFMHADGTCIVAGAGHPAPVLNGHTIDLPGTLPLGIVAAAEYRNKTVPLKEGDHFALYTDGLLEARNSSGEIFSFERLDELFATRPGAAEATQAAVDFGQDDDITVLTLTRLASGQKSTTQLISLGMLRGVVSSS